MPQEFLRGKYSPTTCICHATFAQRSGAIARGEVGAQRPSETGRRRARRPPDKVDAFGEHDQRCKAAFPLARHNRNAYIVGTYIALGVIVIQMLVRTDAVCAEQRWYERLIRDHHDAAAKV